MEEAKNLGDKVKEVMSAEVPNDGLSEEQIKTIITEEVEQMHKRQELIKNRKEKTLEQICKEMKPRKGTKTPWSIEKPKRRHKNKVARKNRKANR